VLLCPPNGEPGHAKDVRDIALEDLSGLCAIIHLAALSNDPLGEMAPNLTEEINCDATSSGDPGQAVRDWTLVYSSSQQYGVSSTDQELDEARARKNPITAYARPSGKPNRSSPELSGLGFTVVCCASTVFGWSPAALRHCVQQFRRSAYTTGRIEIRATARRGDPSYMCATYVPVHCGLERGGDRRGRAYNVRQRNGNYGFEIWRRRPAAPCRQQGRVYRRARTGRAHYRHVSFAPSWTVERVYQPEWTASIAAERARSLFRQVGFQRGAFRGRMTTACLSLNYLLA